MTFSDIFERILKSSTILISQTYFDWQFAAQILKKYYHIICSFASYMSGIPPDNFTSMVDENMINKKNTMI